MGAFELKLTREERKQLDALMESDGRQAQHAQIVLLAAEGRSVRETADLLRISRPTVQHWRTQFLKSRLKAILREDRGGRPTVVTGAIQSQLKAARDAGDSVRATAARLGIGRSTVSKALARIPTDSGHVKARTDSLELELTAQQSSRTTSEYRLSLQFRRQRFSFRLFSRPVEVGLEKPLTYYWMGLPDFRAGKRTQTMEACLDFSWALENPSADTDTDRIAPLILAESFPHVSKAKSLQHIFSDATLGKRKSISLPVEAEAEIERIANTRSVPEIRQYLEEMLAAGHVPEHRRAQFQVAYHRWLKIGYRHFLEGGKEGVRRWSDTDFKRTYDSYVSAGDRDGTQADATWFAKCWAYESKASFYTCYNDLWAFIIAELERSGLDRASATFMRLWHHQNPNHVTADPFWGQVLALHPLTQFILLNQPRQIVVGNWLRSCLDSPHHIYTDEYWRLVRVILEAVAEYNLALSVGRDQSKIRAKAAAINRRRR